MHCQAGAHPFEPEIGRFDDDRGAVRSIEASVARAIRRSSAPSTPVASSAAASTAATIAGALTVRIHERRAPFLIAASVIMPAILPLFGGAIDGVATGARRHTGHEATELHVRRRQRRRADRNPGSAPTARTVSYPSGVAVAGSALVVSDTLNRRFLVFGAR